jgi:hypothetical protein
MSPIHQLAEEVGHVYGIHPNEIPPTRVLKKTVKLGESLGWVTYIVDDFDQVISYGTMTIIQEPNKSFETINTVCHEMWHVKQLLEKRRVPHIWNMQVPLLERPKWAQKAIDLGYNSSSVYREGEAYYRAEETAPRLKHWINRL